MKTFSIVNVAAISFLLAGSALADPVALVSSGTTIKVSSNVSIAVPNDVIRVRVNDSSSLQETHKKAVATGAKRVLELKAMLEGFGLKQGTDFVINAVRTYGEHEKGKWDGPIIGYKAHFDGEIIIGHEREDGDDVYKKIAAKFQLSDPQDGLSKAGERAAKMEVRKQLAADAREIAEAHAAGIGCKLGSIISTEEGEGRYRGYGNEAARGLRSAGPVSDTVAAGRTTPENASATFVFACSK